MVNTVYDTNRVVFVSFAILTQKICAERKHLFRTSRYKTTRNDYI